MIYRNLCKYSWHEIWERCIDQPTTIISGILILLLIIISILAPWLAPFDPEYYFDYDHLNNGPSLTYWLGVDSLGRDIFSRILIGARISLLFSIISVTIGMLIGTFLGLLVGYYEITWFNKIIMRACDTLLAFPGILLAIMISTYIDNGLYSIIIAIIIFNIPVFTYLVRNNTLILKRQVYIESMRCIGATNVTILFKHILPGILSYVIIFFAMRIGNAIITAAGLSFLGLGVQPPMPEWGAMLNEARSDIILAPHAIIFPGIAIFFTVLIFNFLADGLQNIINPELK